MSLKNDRHIRSRRRVTPISISKAVDAAETIAHLLSDELIVRTHKQKQKLEWELAEQKRQAERFNARLKKARRLRSYEAMAEGHNHGRKK